MSRVQILLSARSEDNTIDFILDDKNLAKLDLTERYFDLSLNGYNGKFYINSIEKNRVKFKETYSE